MVKDRNHRPLGLSAPPASPASPNIIELKGLNMRRSLTVVLAGFAMLALAAAPALAQYPPAAPAVGVSDTVVTPGQPINVAGAGWLPNSEVTLTFFSDPVVLGTAVVDGNGEFTAQVTIPAAATPGRHTLRTTGLGAGGQARTVDVALTVAAAPTPDRAGVTPSPRLPRTGGEALVALLTAGGLLAVGSTAVVVARRRSQQA